MGLMLKRILFGFIAFIAAMLLFVLVMYLVTSGNQSVPATVSDDPNLPTIEANGYRFHGEVLGSPDDPTVILLHGVDQAQITRGCGHLRHLLTNTNSSSLTSAVRDCPLA